MAGHGDPLGSRKGALQAGTIWWVAPTYGMASEVWRTLRVAAEDGWREKREVERRLVLPTGGSITVKSADNPDSLRGAGLDGVVLDEAALLQPEVWTHVLRPALSDKQGWALLLTTPRGQANWIHDLWLGAEDSNEWARWQMPTAMNPHIPPQELEAARASLGSHVFRQEYLAEFVQRSAILPVNSLRHARVSQDAVVLRRPDGDVAVDLSQCVRFAVVDLAASVKQQADYTAILVAAVTPDADLVLLDLVRGRMEAPEQMRAVMRAHEHWRTDFILVEATQYQLSFIQLARRQGLPVREQRADRDKLSRALIAQARMEQGAVYMAEGADWGRDFVDELASFPDGAHDDQVDVLSYAAMAAMAGFADWSRIYSGEGFEKPGADNPWAGIYGGDKGGDEST